MEELLGARYGEMGQGFHALSGATTLGSRMFSATWKLSEPYSLGILRRLNHVGIQCCA